MCVKSDHSTTPLISFLPALHHESVDGPWTAGGRGLTVSRVHQTDYLTVWQPMKWFVAHRPYFKQNHAIAPDIIGCGILLVEQCLERKEEVTHRTIHAKFFPFFLPLSLSLVSAPLPCKFSSLHSPPSIPRVLFLASPHLLPLFLLFFLKFIYLWGSPLHRNLASTGLVVCIIYQIPCQSKISNLEWNENHVFQVPY